MACLSWFNSFYSKPIYRLKTCWDQGKKLILTHKTKRSGENSKTKLFFRVTNADCLDDHGNTGNDGCPVSENNGQGNNNVQQRSLVCGETSWTKQCIIMSFLHETKAFANQIINT